MKRLDCIPKPSDEARLIGVLTKLIRFYLESEEKENIPEGEKETATGTEEMKSDARSAHAPLRA